MGRKHYRRAPAWFGLAAFLAILAVLALSNDAITAAAVFGIAATVSVVIGYLAAIVDQLDRLD